MLAVTHLVVSLLLIYVLTLDRNDSFVALMFGVLIDVDHLFGLKGYVETNGIASLTDLGSLMNADGQWKSMLHNPVAVMVVGPVATASRIALPLLFWGVHISMDYVEDSFLGLFSVWEMALLAGSSAALLALGYWRHRMADPGCNLRSFVLIQAARLVSPFRRARCAVFGPPGP